jgi:hypothetical protein
MPVFINEVVVRGEVPRTAGQGGAASAATAGAADREAIVAEVVQALIHQLERERDRIGER